MNARKISKAQKYGRERTKTWWKQINLVIARKSGHERTKIVRKHESWVNAGKSGHERRKVCWTLESLDMNARKSGERTKVWTWKHESLANARKSGHRKLPSGTVWTYLLPSGTSAWDFIDDHGPFVSWGIDFLRGVPNIFAGIHD